MEERTKRGFEFDNEGNFSGTAEGYTFTFNHFFVIVVGCLILILLLHICWNYFRKSEDKKEQDEETQSLVIASEVKPGYLIIQGNSNEEIFRIIKEYETAHGKSIDSPTLTNNLHNYGITGEQFVPNSFQEASLLGQSAAFYSQSAASAPPGMETRMMQYRPPPYAPNGP